LHCPTADVLGCFLSKIVDARLILCFSLRDAYRFSWIRIENLGVPTKIRSKVFVTSNFAEIFSPHTLKITGTI